VTQCAKCGKNEYLMPLHGERGGPGVCITCLGAWHAEHGRKRNRGRIVLRAIKGFYDAGGKREDLLKLDYVAIGMGLGFFDRDYDPLGFLAGIAKVADDEEVELTSELLNDTLSLVHPDKHPPERKEQARRVTAQLLALKPFVFPARKPKPIAPHLPRTGSAKYGTQDLKEPVRQTYPCADCKSTIPYYYCDSCKTEHERRAKEKNDQLNAKQREWYQRRKERSMRLLKTCPSCGGSLNGKRKDARFCSDRCKQKERRRAKAAA
jgi:hypothetical protein